MRQEIFLELQEKLTHFNKKNILIYLAIVVAYFKLLLVVLE